MQNYNNSILAEMSNSENMYITSLRTTLQNLTSAMAISFCKLLYYIVPLVSLQTRILYELFWGIIVRYKMRSNKQSLIIKRIKQQFILYLTFDSVSVFQPCNFKKNVALELILTEGNDLEINKPTTWESRLIQQVMNVFNK